MKKFLCITCILFSIVENTIGQSVAINTSGTTANASSILDVQSITKGMLIPRMTKGQKNAIASPATGLLIYQGAPDSTGFYYYNSSQWIWLNSFGGNDWKLTGNAGTDTAVNFIGTTDSEPLRFKQNDLLVGQLNTNNGTYFLGKLAGRSNTTGTQNIAFGDSALYANTTGATNMAIGYRALQKNITGSGNTAFGSEALLSNTTSGNTAMGSSALTSNTNGANNTSIGNGSMFSNINGNFNSAVGTGALQSNTSGGGNTSIGGQSLSNNTTGSNNAAAGFNALQNNTIGNRNIAIGTAAASLNTTGNNNIAIGIQSLGKNVVGSNNFAIGDSAAFNNTVSETFAIGSKALYSNTTGQDNFAIGTSALYSNTVGFRNVALGNYALLSNTNGDENTAIGDGALISNITGVNNTALGASSISNNTAGIGNTAIGAYTLRDLNSGGGNVAIGESAMMTKVSGSNNIGIGSDAGSSNFTGSTNVFIGNNAGFSNNGSSNVFIGNSAGSNELGSNKLVIDNSSTLSPLIYGDFAINLLRVNGTLNINNDYSFPTIDGTTNQVLQTNGAGLVSWGTVNGESTTAGNGLSLNVVTGVIKLGGTLIENTTINQGNFNLTNNLNGTGNFLVTTPTNNALSVLNTGNTGINTSTPTHRLHLINTIAGSTNNYTNGMFIQNNSATAGQATLAFKNTLLPGNKAWITGMNTFDNYVIAYGDSLSATNVVLRVDTAGYVGINPAGFPGSRLDVVGSFGNAIRVVSTNQTLGDDDHTIIVATGTGAITITLPAASSCERREYVIVNRTGTDKTISPAYNDFSGTATTAPANASITLQSNGTNWFRIR